MSYKPFQYLKCSSAGISTTNTQSKLPLTEEESGSLFTVSGDTVNINGDGVYAINATVQVQSTVQRLQATLKVFVNGVYDGVERGGSYIRNAGTSYDFWSMNFYTLKTLSSTDTIEFYISAVQGVSYDGTSSLNYSVNSTGNEFIIERRQ